MTRETQDPLGNVFSYPTGEASVTSQVKVWEAGFKSPWHYHPYTGVAYVVQGELTVNYDTETALDATGDEKTIIKSETYKAGDKEKGAYYHLMQYTMKILLNSLYGATALGSFRYGNVILSEAITLSGQRIIQESALCPNRHMNKVIKNKLKLNI